MAAIVNRKTNGTKLYLEQECFLTREACEARRTEYATRMGFYATKVGDHCEAVTLADRSSPDASAP